ncbi:LysR family transcriptional regulator [Massilia dura]|uniref:LysR family transcriptional regulator n=2 Tax=Pseudoduganella dura TaxID=321982 RepID=A0A6I3XQ49_9BURK|nr:LysR family transcriptional regulator [Pseudoduganella dura]MUI15422.1 LysR family transcriptional regulator [Pseudoduganella dura]
MRTDLLRYLHVFAVVAEYGCIRASCDALVKAPSTLTRAIASLEGMLATTLFDRTASGLRLTAHGDLVRQHVRKIRAELVGVHAEALSSPGRIGPVAEVAALFNESRLRLAVLLAAQGHMPSVATAGCVTQPAVSQAIKHLESSLGQAMFARAPVKMMPTEQATEWISCFERVLRELDILRYRLRSAC